MIYDVLMKPDPVRSRVVIGSMYLQGRGIGRAPVKAAYWFENAASQGNMEAQSIIVSCISMVSVLYKTVSWPASG